MNRRNFFKSVLGGLGLALFPSFFSKKTKLQVVSNTAVEDNDIWFLNTRHIKLTPRINREQYPWMRKCDDLTMKVYYQPNFSNQWRPIRSAIITNIGEPS